MVGGYSDFVCLTDEAKEVLGKVDIPIGVNYAPFAVSKQIVNGTNYKFLTNATIANQEQTKYVAEIIIYQPLEGEPILTHIQKVDV